MDVLIAGIIVALISAVAFIAVALVTARARIGVLQARAVPDSSNPSHVQSDLSESAKKFRVLGWVLVVLFYLVATSCLLQGFNDLRIALHWEQWEAYKANKQKYTSVALAWLSTRFLKHLILCENFEPACGYGLWIR